MKRVVRGIGRLLIFSIPCALIVLTENRQHVRAKRRSPLWPFRKSKDGAPLDGVEHCTHDFRSVD